MDQNYYNNGVYPQPDIPQNQQPNEEKKGAMGLISLILGIVSIPATCCFGAGSMFGIPAIILGAISQKKDGRGKIGMILGIVGSALSVIVGIVALCIIVFSEMDTPTSNYDDYDIDDYYGAYDEDDDWYLDDDYSTTEWTEAGTEDIDGVSGYVPSYAVMEIGDEFVGYSYAPNGWLPYEELGGTGFTYSVQWANPENGTEIINLSSMSVEDTPEGVNAEYFAEAVAEGERQSDLVDSASVTLEAVTYNGINGYLITSYYMVDDMTLYIFTFDGPNGELRYLSVETYNDGMYTDLYKTVLTNFGYDGVSATAGDGAGDGEGTEISIHSDKTKVIIHTAPEGFNFDSNGGEFCIYFGPSVDTIIYEINPYAEDMTIEEFLQDKYEVKTLGGMATDWEDKIFTDASGRTWVAYAYSSQSFDYTVYYLTYATKLENGEVVSMSVESMEEPIKIEKYEDCVEPSCLEIVEQ